MNRKFGDFLDMFTGSELHQSSIVTNGTILPEEMLEKVVRAGISRLTFSIDSADKEMFEHIRRGGDFDRILENIRKLQVWKAARGSSVPSVQINCILMKDNIGELTRIIELAKELGADELNIRHVIPIDGLEMKKQSLYDQREMADAAVLAASRRAREIGLYMPTVPLFDESKRDGAANAVARMTDRTKRTVKKYIQVNWMKPRCRQPWENLSIHPNGDVYPCDNWTYDPSTRGASLLFPPQDGTTSKAEDFRMGNLNEQNFSEIWSCSKFVELRRSHLGETPMKDACVKCPLRLGQGNETYSPKTDVVERLRFWSRSAGGAGVKSPASAAITEDAAKS
jgi:MoaA/NifB/PqqE/SkfB family radical SAM enzyme